MTGRTCAWCASSVDDATDPATAMLWTVSIEAGVVRHECPACVRANLRSVEAKLDSPDW